MPTWKHTYVSAKADLADTGVVRPSDWNAAHGLYDLAGAPLQGTITIDARDYGVIGDGSDQTTALTNAITAATTQAGVTGAAVLELPCGYINISSTSQIGLTAGTDSSPVCLKGQGPRNTLIRFTGASAGGLYVHDNPQCFVKDLALFTFIEQTSGAMLTAIDNYEGQFTGLSINDGFQGIVVQSAIANTFRDIEIQAGGFFSDVSFKPGSACIVIDNATGHVDFEQVHFHSAATGKVEYGVVIKNCDFLKFLQCHGSGMRKAYFRIAPTSGVHNLSILGCDIDDGVPATEALIEIVSDGTHLAQAIRINSNTLNTTGSEPIILLNAPELTDYLEVGNTFGGTTIHTNTAFAAGGIKYEEDSTYVPTITGSVSNPTVTYTIQNGNWERSGHVIHVSGYIQINTISGGSGNVQISLPFTCSTAFPPIAIMTRTVAWGTSRTQVIGQIEESGAFFTLMGMQNDVTTNTVQISDIAAGDQFVWNGTYRTDQ